MSAAKWHGYWVRQTRTGINLHLVEDTGERSVVALCGACAHLPVPLPLTEWDSEFHMLVCSHCLRSEELRRERK